MKIAIFGNSFQTKKNVQVQRLLDALIKCNAEVWMCDEFYHFLCREMQLLPQVSGLIIDDDFTADVALSVGGDGTFLKTAQRVGDKGIPVLGINTGRLGFLADVASNEIEETIVELFKNYYTIEERSLLQLHAESLPADVYPFALNEIAVSKRDTSSMITIHTYIDNVFLTAYQSDGLIVATPSGSTAYSLSVGGPILVPEARNFVLTPVAPHSLNVRPLVIPDTCEVSMRIESRSDHFLISLDGRSVALPKGTLLSITRANYTVRVIKRHRHSFYNTLRNKMLWGVDQRVL